MPTPHSTASDPMIDDPFLLDNEHIESLADPGRIRAGLQLSTDHAVTALDRHEAGLYDQGEDTENGLWFWPQKTISRLKNKGHPRSGETGMFFMPPRRARAGGLPAGGVITPSEGKLQGFPKARRVI